MGVCYVVRQGIVPFNDGVLVRALREKMVAQVWLRMRLPHGELFHNSDAISGDACDNVCSDARPACVWTRKYWFGNEVTNSYARDRASPIERAGGSSFGYNNSSGVGRDEAVTSGSFYFFAFVDTIE